ncbi:MAG: GNAT family N-acetyltransferase [Phycisphaerales bacterium]
MDSNIARIEPGSWQDFHALAHLHYRAGRPATATAIYRAVLEGRPTIAARARRDSETADVVAGVLIVSLPHLGCCARSAAIGDRYQGLSHRSRAYAINHDFRTISRVIVDPRCRGMGIAVGLVRHALEHAQTACTEALAVMGRVHPFFERAGMMRFEPAPDPRDERMQAAFEWIATRCNRDWRHLAALPSQCCACLDALQPHERAWFLHELSAWYRTRGNRRSSRSQKPIMDTQRMLKAVQQRLMARPLYYLACTQQNGDSSHAHAIAHDRDSH